MKNTLIASVLLATAAIAPSAMADTNFAAAIYGGTSGLGVGLTYKLTDTVNLRGVVNHYDYSHTDTVDDIEYDLELKLQSVEALADWHLFDNKFRVTGGLVHNGNEITGNGRPARSGTVEVGDQVFSTDDVREVNAKGDFRSIAPYLGIGYGNAFKGGRLSFNADLGVLFQGKPNLETSGRLSDTASPEVRARFEEALATETQKLEDDLDKLDLYPIARLSLSYRF